MAVLGRSRSGAPPLIKSWIRPCMTHRHDITGLALPYTREHSQTDIFAPNQTHS